MRRRAYFDGIRSGALNGHLEAGTETEILTKGRHDPCVGIRAVPVGEAMMAAVILDHLLLDRGQTGGIRGKIG